MHPYYKQRLNVPRFELPHEYMRMYVILHVRFDCVLALDH